MSIGGRIKRVHQLDVLERLDKKNPKLAQEPVLNRRRHAVDNSSSANWTQEKTTVTNGDITLEVGSRITGYEACGISDWYVLGAENGKLLITTTRGNEKVELHGREGYLNGLEILNNTVKDIYNDGNFADTVRSINVEDVNRVTGYNPETARFGTNKLWQYGNEVTFYWGGSDYPYYSGSNGVTGNLDWRHGSGFYYPKADGFNCSQKSTTASRVKMQGITKLTSTCYLYSLCSYLTKSSVAYQLLFSGKSYWLGSPYVGCGTIYAGFGLRSVDDGSVYGIIFADSNGGEGSYYYGVLPVVTLKSEVIIDKDGKIYQ